MKNNLKNKLISFGLIVPMIVLFLTSTIFYLKNKTYADYYYFDFNNYNNLSNNIEFMNQLENKTGFNINSFYIMNGGSIETNKEGNITYLNIACMAEQKNNEYYIDIQKESEEYVVIKSQSDHKSNFNNKIYLNDILKILSLWELSDNYKTIIEFDNNYFNYINCNHNNSQYVFVNNKIEPLDSDLEGLYTAIFILSNNHIEEIYFKI